MVSRSSSSNGSTAFAGSALSRAGDGTDDIFIHMETLRRYGIAELKPGDSLLVRFGDGPKGLMAAEVRLLEAALPSSH